MTMLNQAAVEALCSATYLENYLDAMENLPDDIQRIVTQMRELDIICREILQDLDHHQEIYLNEPDGPAKRKALIGIQRALIKCREIGDEKLSLMGIVSDHIENRARQLEQDRENLDPTSGKEPEKEEPVTVSTKQSKQEEKSERVVANKRQRRQKTHDNTKEEDKKEEKEKPPKKKKKRKTKKEKEQAPQSPIDPPIDPDEPTYCLCDQVSYGEMIGCDNEQCVIEWFHFNCVGLTNKPKGKWFCPNCRGDTSKVMRKFDK